jgi:hypothetical protein
MIYTSVVLIGCASVHSFIPGRCTRGVYGLVLWHKRTALNLLEDDRQFASFIVSLINWDCIV